MAPFCDCVVLVVPPNTYTHAHARAHPHTRMLQVSNVAAEDEDDAKWRENCQRLLDLVPDERQSAALSMGPIRL